MAHGEQPVSTDIRHAEGTLGTEDELSLFWQSWSPSSPRGTLLVVHGLAEHSGRYAEMAQWFASRGYAVVAFDHRGHGRSPGKRVHVERFAEFVADLRAAEAFCRQRGLPVVLVAHSQGGLVSLRYAQDGGRSDGIVLSSPFLGVHQHSRPPLFKEVAASWLSPVLGGWLQPSSLDPTTLSRDKKVVDAYMSDPLVSHRVSPRWFTETRETLQTVHRDAGQLRTPMLVLYGEADRLVDPEATKAFFRRAPKELFEEVGLPGFFHEILNEPEKEQVFRRIETWLERRGPFGPRRSANA